MGWLIWKERKRKIRGGSLWASGPDCASKMLFSSVFPRLSARSDTTSLYIYNIMISLYITHLQKSIQISIRDHKKGIRVWSFPNSQIIRSQTSILSSCKIFGIWRLIIFRTFGSFIFLEILGFYLFLICPAVRLTSHSEMNWKKFQEPRRAWFASANCTSALSFLLYMIFTRCTSPYTPSFTCFDLKISSSSE